MVDLGFVLFQRYDGDVGDLGLTLSYDEDVMGQVETIYFFSGYRKTELLF